MKRGAVLASIAWAASFSACGHEFWLTAAPSRAAPDAPVSMTLQVGESFKGERVGITASHAASLTVFSARAERDLGTLVPQASMLPSLALAFAEPGSQVIAYESHPSRVVLEAGSFHAYLHDEGLDAVIRQREAAGTAAQPGRERFRRSAKALLQVGGRADGASTRATGQRLEIRPLADPLAAAAGDTLRFALAFEGRPLAGALVKAWHRQGRQVTVLRATADAQGELAFVLPFAGQWMLNTVHMVAAPGDADVDWDSFWGSLSFELAAPARAGPS